MTKQLEQIAEQVKYHQLDVLVGQSVQVDSLETLVSNVQDLLATQLNNHIPYIGRWNTNPNIDNPPNDTEYVFASIGNFDMKFNWSNQTADYPFQSGMAFLEEMEIDLLMELHGNLIDDLSQQVSEGKMYLLLLFAIDNKHEPFADFREKIRHKDSEAIKTAEAGFPASYFPVNCQIIASAVTNAPALWIRYSVLWMYTYLYNYRQLTLP